MAVEIEGDADLGMAAADLGEDDLLDALDEARQASVVTEPLGGDVDFSFTHELIRQTLLSRLSSPRRRRHHRRVAEALEGIPW